MTARSLLTAVILFLVVLGTARGNATTPFCAEQLTREQALGITLSGPTFAQPPVKQIRRLRSRVDHILAHAGALVSQAELDRLRASMVALEENGRSLSEHRRTITNVIAATEAALIQDYREHVDVVIPALVRNAAIEDLNADPARAKFLRKLIDQAIGWRNGGLTFIAGAKDWTRAREAAATVAASRHGLSPELSVRRTTLVTTDAESTGGEFAFARDLGIFGTTDRGRTFEAFLKIRYVAPTALEREERRAKYANQRSSSTPRYLRVDDLNRALSFFNSPPLVGANGSKVTLDGSADKHGRIVKVSAVFDPRTRYFTVVDPQVPAQDGYHQMIPDAEGRLTFVDHPTIDQTLAGQRLDLTHFAY